MTRKLIIKISVFIGVVLSISSCLLEGNQLNLPPGGGGGSFLLMTYNTGANSANTNSGISPTAFSNCALSFPATHKLDSANFAVTLQGPVLSKDVTVTIKIDNSRLLDNFATDSIPYVALPDSTYSFSSLTGVIKAGKTYAQFTLYIKPNKINAADNFMLPITATNDSNLPIATNYQTIYIHAIGNPIAGGYTWNFTRCSTPDCANGPDGTSFSGASTIFSPVNPTTVRVPTGYYTQPSYIITFTNTGGVLSNFQAIIDPVAVANDWTPVGVTIASGPTILVENNNTKFTLHYTTATRNCTDVYIKN